MTEPASLTRRKPYNKVRLLSWLITLDRVGYVLCPYQRCRFMAFDVEEMVEHFSWCNGVNEGLILNICSVCNRGADTLYKIKNHMIYNHPIEASKLNLRHYTIPPKKIENKEIEICIPKIQKLSWQLLWEHKGYIKCFFPYCLYLTDEYAQMEKHYGNCLEVVQSKVLKFSCNFCGGRTEAQEKMDRHIADCHPDGTNINTPTNYITNDLIDVWKNNIETNKIANCVTEGCNYISHDIPVLKRHFRFCRTPCREKYAVCPKCCNWVLPNTLEEHIEQFHVLKEEIKSPQASETIPFENTDLDNSELSVCPLFYDFNDTVEDYSNKDINIETDLVQGPTFPVIEPSKQPHQLKQYKSNKQSRFIAYFPPVHIPKRTRDIDVVRTTNDTLLPLQVRNLNECCFHDCDFKIINVDQKWGKNETNESHNIAGYFQELKNVLRENIKGDNGEIREIGKRKRGRPPKKSRLYCKRKKNENSDASLKDTTVVNSVISLDNPNDILPNKEMIAEPSMKSTSSISTDFVESCQSNNSCKFENTNIDKVETKLEQLSRKIMTENKCLIPIKISVNNERWTLNVPPPAVAHAVVERERQHFKIKNILKRSFVESHNFLKLTRNLYSIKNRNIPHNYNIRSSNVSGRSLLGQNSINPLLESILNLKINNMSVQKELPNESSLYGYPEVIKKITHEIQLQEKSVYQQLGIEPMSDYSSEEEAIDIEESELHEHLTDLQLFGQEFDDHVMKQSQSIPIIDATGRGNLMKKSHDV